MGNMRELTKKELKLFEAFVKGYSEGLNSMTRRTVRNVLGASEEDIHVSYVDTISFWKRRKVIFEQFHNGYMAGFFRRCSSELPVEQLDPLRCSDIYHYLQSVWLHSYVYPDNAAETQSK